MRSFRAIARSTVPSLLIAATVVSQAQAQTSIDAFPEPGPGSRAEAEAALLVPEIDGGGLSVRLAGDPTPGEPRAVALLHDLRWSGAIEDRSLPGGAVLRFTTDPTSPDAIDTDDRDANGRPDAIDAVVRGWSDAVNGLAGILDLDAAPLAGAVLVVRPTVPGVDGYAMVPAPTEDAAASIVLAPARYPDDDRAYRAAVREAAFVAVRTVRPGLPARWADAFARWFTGTLAGLDADDLRAFATRRDRWNEGLASDDPRAAAGNALWLTWLAEAHGPHAVRVALAELAAHEDPGDAADRIAARIAGTTGALFHRDFQAWSLLTGDLDDGLHFSFAGRLPRPSFPVDADWLPVISVQSDAPVAPLGGSTFRLAPSAEEDREGGMTVRFEGGFDARWSADLVLRRADRTLQRVPIDLDEGRGEVTVPRAELVEAFLLVRNDGPVGRAPARFTWSAHAVRGFPFELAGLDVRRADGDVPGVLLAWETSTETRLLGFHLTRRPADGGTARRVTPIFVPAIGGATDPAAYQFLDASADPDRAYVYRIVGITLEGLTATSAPVRIEPDASR